VVSTRSDAGTRVYLRAHAVIRRTAGRTKTASVAGVFSAARELCVAGFVWNVAPAPIVAVGRYARMDVASVRVARRAVQGPVPMPVLSAVETTIVRAGVPAARAPVLARSGVVGVELHVCPTTSAARTPIVPRGGSAYLGSARRSVGRSARLVALTTPVTKAFDVTEVGACSPAALPGRFVVPGTRVAPPSPATMGVARLAVAPARFAARTTPVEPVISLARAVSACPADSRARRAARTDHAEILPIRARRDDAYPVDCRAWCAARTDHA